MAGKKKMMLNSVSKLRDLLIYLMKTPFQLNRKLHNIFMPLLVESYSCDCSEAGIFSRKETY